VGVRGRTQDGVLRLWGETVFSIVDAFTGKKKLKDVLSGILNDEKL